MVALESPSASTFRSVLLRKHPSVRRAKTRSARSSGSQSRASRFTKRPPATCSCYALRETTRSRRSLARWQRRHERMLPAKTQQRPASEENGAAACGGNESIACTRGVAFATSASGNAEDGMRQLTMEVFSSTRKPATVRIKPYKFIISLKLE